MLQAIQDGNKKWVAIYFSGGIFALILGFLWPAVIPFISVLDVNYDKIPGEIKQLNIVVDLSQTLGLLTIAVAVLYALVRRSNKNIFDISNVRNLLNGVCLCSFMFIGCLPFISEPIWFSVVKQNQVSIGTVGIIGVLFVFTAD